MQSWLYINNSIAFEESTGKNALISAVVMELNKVSQQNTFYEVGEGNRMAKSLVGKNVYFGTDAWTGKHKKGEPVGIVERAKKLGNTIKAWIRITDSTLVEALKRGKSYLFSVGGVSDFFEVVRRGGQRVKKFVNCVMSHLQILPVGVTVGFPNARLERVLEINESVLLIDETGLSAEELVLLHVNLSMF